MTAQEAIETIKIAIAEAEWEYPMSYAVAFDIAVDALKMVEQIRQIVTDPIYIQEDVLRYKMICEILSRGIDR